MNQLKRLPSLFLQAFFVATAAILALVVVTKYVAPVPISITQTTTQKDTAFSATGKSTITVIPDKADINLGVNKRSVDIKDAQNQANQVIDTITQKLTDLGISKDDIKTENYSIYPNYDYQKATQNLIDYSVNISLQVSLHDFSKLNQVIDIATASGATQVGGVDFSISDQLEKSTKLQARSQAIEDAKNNASDLARLAGVRLGKVINVIETPTTPIQPIPYLDRMAAGAAVNSAPTNVQPGSTTYTYSVTLNYETL